ncbi:hypothetical protein GCM10010421_33690 [Streptomyces glaucus]|uniref:Secreted protein n=1 Tax=Streptomyces glaucus TaxID=284029 RepID=A0ABN3JU24_9ACTN
MTMAVRREPRRIHRDQHRPLAVELRPRAGRHRGGPHGEGAAPPAGPPCSTRPALGGNAPKARPVPSAPAPYVPRNPRIAAPVAARSGCPTPLAAHPHDRSATASIKRRTLTRGRTTARPLRHGHRLCP